jgi:triosephosphate isomerase
MSRQFIVAGNWKMNLDQAGALALAAELAERHPHPGNQQVALFPPFPWLGTVEAAVAGSDFWVGAQNCYPEPAGAFTGEVSAAMLSGLCDAALAGHSERRQLFGESNELVGRKVSAIVGAGLYAFLCVGETLEQREAGEAESVVAGQLEAGVADLHAAGVDRLVVAYEPVWAIGTGIAATADDAQAMCAFVRERLRRRFGDAGAACAVLYGGSVTPDNAPELFSQADIDGALVGGASLKAETFGAILEAAEARV